MMEYTAAAMIDAPVERVWRILEDAARYPEWDPYCDRVEGRVARDAKLKVYSKLTPGRAFPVRVAELEPERRMVWRGGMPLGLFKGLRTFEVKPLAGGRTEFAMREVFSGPMLPLMRRVIPDMTESFQAFARGLKERAEAAD
jgi:hypothetical protein